MTRGTVALHLVVVYTYNCVQDTIYPGVRGVCVERCAFTIKNYLKPHIPYTIKTSLYVMKTDSSQAIMKRQCVIRVYVCDTESRLFSVMSNNILNVMVN